MNYIIQLSRSLISAGIVGFVAVAGIYHFAPSAYAYAAYHIGPLPMTNKVKKASPDIWFQWQEERLEVANAELKGHRDDLSRSRVSIERKDADYQHKGRQVNELLVEARKLFQANPDAKEFYFVGKHYSPGEFSAQVVVLDAQSKAVKEAIVSLSKAKEKVDSTWVAIARKEAQLSADKTRLETAHILWQTERLLSDLDIDINLGEVQQLSEHSLRNIEELMRDAEKLSIDPEATKVAPDESITAEALSILTQG